MGGTSELTALVEQGEQASIVVAPPDLDGGAIIEHELEGVHKLALVLHSWIEQLMRRVVIVLGSPSLQRPTIIDALQEDLGVSSASTVSPISRPVRRLSLRGVEDFREVRRPGTTMVHANVSDRHVGPRITHDAEFSTGSRPQEFDSASHGRHERRVFNMANSDVDADTESVPSHGSLEHDSRSENGDGVSVTEGQEPDEVERVEPLQFVPVSRRVREGFATLDSVDLVSVFKRRAHVMRSVPTVIKGAYCGWGRPQAGDCKNHCIGDW